MQRISLDQYGREVPCIYRGESYAVRDNGAICRQQRPNMRRRLRDGQWTFGTPCNHAGYMKISTESVHRIIATAFHGDAPSKSHVVDHIDTNRRNNRPENLRWVTRLENILLNPITSRRIVDAYGSIEAFLADPTKPSRGPLESNFEWMRTVSPDEARSSLERMLVWARRDERDLGETLGTWVQRRGLIKEEMQLAQEKESGTKPSLTDGAAQRKWQVPTEFPRCPKPGSQSDLQTYAAALSTGDVFSRNQFGDVLVLAKGWTPDGSGLLIMSQMPESTQKHWALAQVTREDGVFVHDNCGSFFMEDGAQKYFTLAQGLEWTGGETFDDYC